MQKSKLRASYSYGDDDDDEHIYDSISDFDQTHFQTHSMNNIYRASCTSFITTDFCSRKSGAPSVADVNDNNCWQQYWDW